MDRQGFLALRCETGAAGAAEHVESVPGRAIPGFAAHDRGVDRMICGEAPHDGEQPQP